MTYADYWPTNMAEKKINSFRLNEINKCRKRKKNDLGVLLLPSLSTVLKSRLRWLNRFALGFRPTINTPSRAAQRA